MTTEELISKLKSVQKTLETETRNQAAVLATTGLALIKNRIIPAFSKHHVMKLRVYKSRIKA